MADRLSTLYSSLFVNFNGKAEARKVGGRIRIASDVCAPGVAPVNADAWVFGCVIPKGARLLMDGRWRSIGFTAGGTSPGMDLKLRRLDTGIESGSLTAISAGVGTTAWLTHSVSPGGLDESTIPSGGYILLADSVPVVVWSTGGGLPTGTGGKLDMELYYTLD